MAGICILWVLVCSSSLLSQLATLSPRGVVCMNICHHCQQVVYFHSFLASFSFSLFPPNPLLLPSLPSQFHRSLPGPPDLTPAEVSSLVQRYRDPSSGLYNYMQFHTDIERLGREEEGGGSGPPQPPSMPVRTLEWFFFTHYPPPSSQAILIFNTLWLLHSTAHVAVR